MTSRFSITNTHDVEIWVCYGRHKRTIAIATGAGVATAGAVVAICTAGLALIPEAGAAGAVGAGMMGGEMIGVAAGAGLGFVGGLAVQQIEQPAKHELDQTKKYYTLEDGWDKGQPYEGHWHRLKPGETFTSSRMTLSLLWTAYAVAADKETGQVYGAHSTIWSSAWAGGNANWKSRKIFTLKQ